jgi:hypothetical protein
MVVPVSPPVVLVLVDSVVTTVVASLVASLVDDVDVVPLSVSPTEPPVGASPDEPVPGSGVVVGSGAVDESVALSVADADADEPAGSVPQALSGRTRRAKQRPRILAAYRKTRTRGRSDSPTR